MSVASKDELRLPLHGIVDEYDRAESSIETWRDAAARLAGAGRVKDALYRLTDALQSATSLEQIYAAGLDAILSALPCDRASILLFDAQKSLRFVASRGLSERYQSLVDGHSPWSPEEVGAVPICMDDVELAELSPQLRVGLLQEGIHAIGFFPLIGARGLIGKFMTYADEPHAFTAGEIEVSQTIARQIALAIERHDADAALRASEQRLRAELADTQLLQQISSELIDQENVGALYDKIVDAAMRIMRSDFGSMQVLVPERGKSGELRLLSHRGLGESGAKHWEWVTPDSTTSCGTALRTGARVILQDLETAASQPVAAEALTGAADLAAFRLLGIRAAQTTPLFSRGGKLVGMISTHWREPHSPSERDLRLLDILARQAADLIERRRAQDELTSIKDRLAQEVHDLQRLHELSARLMQHRDIETVLKDLLEAAVVLMQPAQGSVQLYDRRTDALRLVSTTGLPSVFNDEFAAVDQAGYTTCAMALRLGRRVIVEDLQTDTRFVELAQAARPHAIRSAQSTPIFDDSGTIAAMLTTYSSRVRRPSERELRLLDLYAEVAVRQIERKRSEEALSLMAELSAAFTPMGSIQNIAQVTGGLLREYFGASRVSLSNGCPGTDELTFFEDRTTHRLSQYVTAPFIATLRAGRTVCVADVTEDERTAPHAAAYVQENIRSMMLAPCIVSGHWRFLLAVFKPKRHAWHAKDLDLLQDVAARVHIRLERARAEEALAESEARLREDDRRKDEFLAMLAHELRNPLAPIVNAVHLLRRSPVADPMQQRVRAIIERQAGRLTRLVDDLLEVSRITSGRIQLHRERITVAGVIDRAVETVRPLIEQHHHTLNLRVPQTPVWLLADATRLEQVVVNLLNNAAKYTDDGGTIELSVQAGATQAVLRVKDNGIGIEQELLPRIFELFTQAERSLDRSSGGLGIGLSLVQRLVIMHGGSVTVDSAVGKGSEFTVRLPLDKARSDDAAAAEGLDSTAPAHPLRVLIVDDNADVTESLRMLLESDGHLVQVASDGEAAIQSARAYRPDVIFLDIGLPKLDGYEVARRLRAADSCRDAMLVAMTGYGQSSDRERAKAAGFEHHLVKPAEFADIAALLTEAARRQQR
jgi:signal transduction histidine kinase/ActR/RegA family two-component response regulator